MKCPYCEKEDFVPTVVFHHTQMYGEGEKNFSCIHCHKIVKINGKRRVVLENPQRTENESDWEWCEDITRKIKKPSRIHRYLQQFKDY